MIAERAVAFVAVDGITLEGRLAVPSGARVGVALCHPHPLYGGDMDSPVVLDAAQACRRQGLATLRFNFRGVGRSDGVHGGGAEERHDAHAALDHLAGALGTQATALLGYSFGAAVAAAVAREHSGLAGLALVAPPIGLTGGDALSGLRDAAGALLVVAGDDDEYCPAAALEVLARGLPPGTVRIMAGADHLFAGHAAALADAIGAWAKRLDAGQPTGRHGPA